MKGLVIGRFQPFHNGHYGMIKWAMERCDFLTIGIGSANTHDERNPFYYHQRRDMVEKTLSSEASYDVIKIPDFGNNDKWIKWIKDNIDFDTFFGNSQNELDIFKNAELETVKIEFQEQGISGTEIRRLLNELKSKVPSGTWDTITGR